MRTMHDELWRYRNMKIETEIPDKLWIEYKHKMEDMSGETWTDRATSTFVQNFINEYIVNAIDE